MGPNVRSWHALARNLRCIRKNAFHSQSKLMAASRFSMPALSPTMTEGNITKWKLQEGDIYSAGDVILEIETDKATMDVEAQDDGVLVKILVVDGSKAIPVGTHIAVLAEADDDLSSLVMPEEEPVDAEDKPRVAEEPARDSSSSKESTTELYTPSVPSSSLGVSPSSPHKFPNPDTSVIAKTRSKSPFLNNGDVSRSLSPAVLSLLELHDIHDHSSIPATGPKDRLLKGDVLAFAKQIDINANKSIQKAYEQRSRLDLSNITVATQKHEPQSDLSETIDFESSVTELKKLVDLTKLIQFSKQLEEENGVRTSVAQLASKAASKALDETPSFALAVVSAYDRIFKDIVSGSTPGYSQHKNVNATTSQLKASPKFKARDHLSPGLIQLPSKVSSTSVLNLQAVATSPDILQRQRPDIYDVLTATPPKILESSIKLKSSKMIANLSFENGSVSPKAAQLFLDRTAEYLEKPEQMYRH